MHIHRSALISSLCVSLAAAITGARAADAPDAFLPRLVNTSTIPSNGDVNPYGVAFVPADFPSGGMIATGDVLVSNFNDASNVQGTGKTIVSFVPSSGPIAAPGTATTFFSSSLPGLSTALGVLREGVVLVGNLPTTKGTFATITGPGALQVIDKNGHWLQTFKDKTHLDGPWDLTIDDWGQTAHVFVSNVLNGTVSRLDVNVTATGIKITQWTTVANGYTVTPNQAAVILGPTGLAYDRASDTLFVASTADNAIYSVSHAAARTSAEGRGNVVFDGSQLRGPLALRFAPNGNLLTANGDAVNADVAHPSEIVEFTRFGQFVRQYNVDASQGGAFGLDTVLAPEAPFNFAVVDDVTNSLAVSRRPAW